MLYLYSSIFFHIFLLILLTAESENIVTRHYCDTRRFTPNSTYENNLNSLLYSLSSNATRPRGFYNLTVGRVPNIVYGLFLCQGAVSVDDCKECFEAARNKLNESCAFERVATIYLDRCMVRYSDKNIFSSVQSDPGFILFNDKTVTSESNRFIELVGEILRATAALAVKDKTGRKFGAMKAKFTVYEYIYTIAQCTPDLSVDNCNKCLAIVIGWVPENIVGGKKGGRVMQPSCSVRFELYPFYDESRATPPEFLPSPPSSTNAKGKGGLPSSTIIAIVVSSGVFVILILVICSFLKRRSSKKDEATREQNDEAEDNITTMDSLQYDFGNIKAATNNFNDESKLGQGGFGSVYKGILPDGKVIAVKRLSVNSGQGDIEFKNEALLVAKLQHRCLVRLLGFCLEGRERILIYEFVPNISLDNFIFDPIKRAHLNWETRYKIIGGIARGLLYLHEDSRLRIIHRDLKASNILLDNNMNPKISDFGMARLFSVDETQGDTNRIVGTYGYMAPEYAMRGHFSIKSDVYSFGVLILEIVSGQKNNKFHRGEEMEDLISQAWKNWRTGLTLNLIDPTLRSGSKSEMMRCIHIGLLCVQENAVVRPTMASVALMLNSSSLALPVPSQPPSYLVNSSEPESNLNRGRTNSEYSKSGSSNMSNNEVSVTDLYPR